MPSTSQSPPIAPLLPPFLPRVAYDGVQARREGGVPEVGNCSQPFESYLRQVGHVLEVKNFFFFLKAVDLW